MRVVLGWSVVAVAGGLAAQRDNPVRGADAPAPFTLHRIGTDHAEGVTVFDVNGDGRPDITSGAYWYENPGLGGGAWTRHKFREVEVTGEFVSDCGEFAVDVNHDGALDIVTAGWQSDGLWWFENPNKPGQPFSNALWKKHLITHTITTEGMVMADINGDGKPDLVAAHYGRQGIFWVDFAGPEPVVHHVGGHEADGHGVGIVDVDGDGKADIVTIHGWFKNIDADHDKWQWMPEWELGDSGFPILGYDVNNDGKMDLIYGHGHDYGVFWLEQTTENGKRAWKRHVIDDSFSQAHALKLADIDGDGQPELITGKRYRGHNGTDPGGHEPLVIYYYKINRKTGTFTRYPLSYNGTAGVGTQIIVADMDGDGDQDIVVAGKTGVHWLENLKIDNVPFAVREQQLLLNHQWPFPDEK